MKKIVFLFTLIILIQSCGFAPVYTSKDNINFNIGNITFEGDQELNNLINIKLKRYISKDTGNKNFKISAKSNYSKQVQSRNAKGNIQSFRLKSSAVFIVSEGNQTYNFVYSEQSDLNNSDDTFELKTYENSIKENFASSIVEKLILDLSSNQ